LNSRISLSIVCALAVNSFAVDLGTIEVKDSVDTEVYESLNETNVKNADFAQALYEQSSSINLIRRSGIANDITLRGQKRDNIVLTVDDSMVCGACPNRMDPPSSHVLVSNVSNVKVNEGPFDVENFGNLSGSVKVETKKPQKDFGGDIYFNTGSFGYQKAGTTVTGEVDNFRMLISASIQKGEQYEDGDGNTLAQQLTNATAGTPLAGMQMKDNYKDMDAYEKKSFMSKFELDITDNQMLTFGYTLNQSDNVLYPNSKMDALYDDSQIFNLGYIIENASIFSDKFQIKAYASDVEHPMSTKYRIASGVDSVDEVISKLTTDKKGIKLINDSTVLDGIFTFGIDINNRNWNGEYTGFGSKVAITGRDAIDDVDTENRAIFLKYDKDFDNLNINVQSRINDTVVKTSDFNDRDFNSIDANIFATLSVGSIDYFVGIGQASRVPDARELYFNSSTNVMSGTPTLDQSTNREIDLGFKYNSDAFFAKAKFFYSMLDDYIYFNKGNTLTNAMGTFAYNSFENIDATLYGVNLDFEYNFNEQLFTDLSVSYQRGQKDKALTSTKVDMTTSTTTTVAQTDKDLADITPLKAKLGINYELDNTFSARAEVISAKSWDKYDSDNGEQKIDGYTTLNLKARKTFDKNYEVIVGVDNVFNRTYAVSNTYSDLILLSDGTTGDVMLLNEPGRYAYINFKYKF
jgi:iron complex outermembrane receptor protein